MPAVVALCLEDLHPLRSTRYVRCVALRGRQPGLGLDACGQIAWKSAAPLACELWVSGDDQLILLRPEGAPEVRVERAGRSLLAPYGKPVVLVDQDVVHAAGRCLRVHVHGEARSDHAPAALEERQQGVGLLAATLALGVAALSCNRLESKPAPPVEIREMPPAVPYLAPPEAGAPQVVSDGAADGGGGPEASDSGNDAGLEAGREAGQRAKAPKPKAIEVREHPPDPID